MGLEGGHYEHLNREYDRTGRSMDTNENKDRLARARVGRETLAEEKIAELFSRADTFTELAWAIEGELPELSEELQRKCIEAVRVLKTEQRPENPFSDAMATVFNEQLKRVYVTATAYLKRYNEEKTLQMKNGSPTTVHEIIQEPSSHEAIICPGSFTGPRNIAEFSKNMALKGYSVTTPEVKRRVEGPQEADTRVMEGYAQSVEAAIEHVLARNPEAQIELIGFSSGAAAVVEAARRHPNAIKKVVLLNPIGIAGVDKTHFAYLRQLVEIAKRSLFDHPSQLKEQRLLNKAQNPQYAGFADFFGRQWNRGLTELPELLHAAATVNLLPKIVELESEHGVPVEIIATDEDKLFPTNEVEDALITLEKELGIPNRLLRLTGIHTKIGAEPGALASMIALSKSKPYEEMNLKDQRELLSAWGETGGYRFWEK